MLYQRGPVQRTIHTPTLPFTLLKRQFVAKHSIVLNPRPTVLVSIQGSEEEK